MIRLRALLIVLGTVLVLPVEASALDADDLSDLVGYRIVAASTVRGDFEGADHGKPVALDNGMVFEFQEYNYSYAYRPSAVVLSMTLTPEDLKRLGLKATTQRAITLYKLIVDDEIYDVTRIR